jgi:hypothetical protein
MVQDDGVDMRRNGQTVMSAVLGSGGQFNAGAEDDTNQVKSIISPTGAVNTVHEDSLRKESWQIIEKNRRQAPRGQVAVERFGTDREIEEARKQAAQASFIAQQAERDATARREHELEKEMVMMRGGGDAMTFGDSSYAPSWNSAALSGEQPGPHTGHLGATNGQLNTSQSRRPRSRPTNEATGGKPTDLRGGAVKLREKESFQNRIEADAVYQKMRSRQNGAGLW